MGTSWSHRLVRPLVRPLLRIGATPNQVTACHLVLGLATLGAMGWGTNTVRLWAGGAWLVCCLLDRLDGELARIGNMCSAAGHRFDYLVDMWLGALYFVALGFSVHGRYAFDAIACGVIACVNQFALYQVAERFDRLSGDAGRVLASRWGFDADDALYLLGPVVWLPTELRLAATVLAAIATILFLGLFVRRLARLRRRIADGSFVPAM